MRRLVDEYVRDPSTGKYSLSRQVGEATQVTLSALAVRHAQIFVQAEGM